jgi:hypothetical protein
VKLVEQTRLARGKNETVASARIYNHFITIITSFVPTEVTRPRKCTASSQGIRAPTQRPTGEQATNGFPRTPTDATRSIPDLPRPQALDLTLGLLGALKCGMRTGVEPRSPSMFAGQSWANGYDDACHGTSFRPASADVGYDNIIATFRTTYYLLQKINCSWPATPASVATVGRLGQESSGTRPSRLLKMPREFSEGVFARVSSCD